MDGAGRPLEDSNWGTAYRQQGILAAGENILVAARGGPAVLRRERVTPPPIVSGVAAFFSAEKKCGAATVGLHHWQALLATAIRCDRQTTADCRRYLAGRLNIPGTISLLDRWSKSMI